MDRNKLPGKIVFFAVDNEREVTDIGFAQMSEKEKESFISSLPDEEVRAYSVVSRAGIKDVVRDYNQQILDGDQWWCGIMD